MGGTDCASNEAGSDFVEHMVVEAHTDAGTGYDNDWVGTA